MTQNIQSQTSYTATSPWTDCFQTNPIHTEGHYEDHDHNDTQEPTQQALAYIYDTEYRSD